MKDSLALPLKYLSLVPRLMAFLKAAKECGLDKLSSIVMGVSISFFRVALL